MKCEYCNSEHDGSYTTGRFCSSKCARGFSTKAKRKEINEKVSKTLKREQILKTFVCRHCDKSFQRFQKRIFCSKKCRKEHPRPPISEKTREIQSQKRCANLRRGKGTKAKKCIFEFQNEQIRCDSLIEFSCLDWFISTYEVKSITRCDFEILYDACDGKKRRYIPDFVIETSTQKFLVECKSYMSVKSINEKWRNYNENAILKKKALFQYCETNNLVPFWFTKDIHIRFYNSLLGSSTGRATGCGKLSAQSA